MEKAQISSIPKNYINYGLVVLLVVAAFLIGSLYTKVQLLEKGGATNGAGQQAAGKYPTYIAGLKDYAKQLKLDTKKFDSCLDGGGKKTAIDEDLKQGESVGVSGTPAFFVNGKFIGGAFPFEAFKDIIDKELSGKSSTNPKDYIEVLSNAYDQGKAFDPVPKNVDVGNAPVKGPQDAKVTIVEFSDFQCPYCERAYPTVNQILKDYDGKVRIAYKQFPLNSIHPKAQKAAEAAECAKEQGKFWEYHNKLFENQSEWVGIAS